MKYGLTAAVALMSVGSPAAAATFIVSLEAGTQTGTGTITIDDSLIGPNAAVLTSATTVNLLFGGFNFSIPFSPTTEQFIFDSLGRNIIGVNDTVGSFVDFGRTDGTFSFVSFREGPVPGTFQTLNLPGGDVQGTFSITSSATGAVPEPSTWAMMLLGFGLIGGGMRAAKRRQKVTISYA